MVLITASSHEEALRLAEMLVDTRLAACVQILPQLESIYRWRGAVERASEFLLLVKTLASRFQELEREVRAVHSYETPEIISLTINQGSQPYFRWLREEATPEKEEQ